MNKAEVVGVPSTPLTLAHNLYGIAYQFYRNKFKLERHAGKDVLLRFLDQSLIAECPGKKRRIFFQDLHFFAKKGGEKERRRRTRIIRYIVKG